MVTGRANEATVKRVAKLDRELEALFQTHRPLT
jgi:hypothetical protein